MSDTPQKIIINLNASALKESACRLRLFRLVHQGWTGTGGLSNNDIEYGSAFHLFMSEMKRTSGNYAHSLQAAEVRYSGEMRVKPAKKYLTTSHLMRTCMDYWEQWVMKDEFVTLRQPECECEECGGSGQITPKQLGESADDIKPSLLCPYCSGTGRTRKPLVEVKFSYPYYCDDQFEVNLCGTIDDIAKHRAGCFALRDYKTTSVTAQEDYLHGYVLNPQLRFYGFYARLMARAYPESIWAEIARCGIHACIEGVFINGADKREFKRSEVFPMRDADLDVFGRMLDKRIANLIEDIRESLKGQRILPDGIISNSCTGIFGGCKFFNVCSAPDVETGDMLLEKYFVQKPYNPLERE